MVADALDRKSEKMQKEPSFDTMQGDRRMNDQIDSKSFNQNTAS